MTRNLKATKVIVVGDAGQGSVSDEIRQVIDNQLERGITITEMLEKDKYFEITNPYRDVVSGESMDRSLIFDKSRSKFHR